METNASILKRREFLHVLGGSVAAASFAGLPACSADSRKPNIVLILADDLGYGDISGFGTVETPYHTKNLSQMASEGVKLTNFYVPVPYCAPSRATLLTGRYPFRNGVVHNPSPDAGINDVGLPPEEITIAEALKGAGYKTSCIGKWHLGHLPHFLPRQQGFDEYYGILYSNDMRPVQLVENEQVAEYPVLQATLTKRYTERALDFMERSVQEDAPFFLYLPHAMPHKPLSASEDFYTPDTPEDLYADVIRELDWSVGQVLEKIKELGIDDNTLVIFTSDNGPWYGGSTGGLRGMKARTWDGGILVPFIARFPGKIPQDIVNHAVVGSIDIFPTLLALAGVGIPEDRKIDGEDILSVLTTEDGQSPHEAIVAMHGTNLAVVRSGPWKLHVRYPGNVPEPRRDWVDPRGPDGVTIIAPYEQSQPADFPGVTGGDESKGLMLFNLENDPAEQHEIGEQHPEIVQRLKAIADDIIQQIPTFEQPTGHGGIRRIQGGRMDFYEHVED